MEPLSIEQRATLLAKMARQIKECESQRCVLHKGRNCSHEDHVADRGFPSMLHDDILPCQFAMQRTTIQQQTVQWTKSGKLQTSPSFHCLIFIHMSKCSCMQMSTTSIFLDEKLICFSMPLIWSALIVNQNLEGTPVHFSRNNRIWKRL